MPPVVTLITDFGPGTYVAQMKGRLLTLFPDVRIVDITHSIAPQDVSGAAMALRDVYQAFPRGTIHLVVVDPGVGTARPLLAIKQHGNLFLGPDNGCLSLACQAQQPWEGVHLGAAEYWHTSVSPTFHGRDILAPVAAHLAQGLPLPALGPVCHSFQQLQPAGIQVSDAELWGVVVSLDHFGNVLTNISQNHVEALALRVEGPLGVTVGPLKDACIGRTYGDVPWGATLGLIDSQGFLELAENGGNASRRWGIERGMPVRVAPLPCPAPRSQPAKPPI